MKVLNSLECNEGDGDDDDDTLHIVLMFGTFRLSSYVPFIHELHCSWATDTKKERHTHETTHMQITHHLQCKAKKTNKYCRATRTKDARFVVLLHSLLIHPSWTANIWLITERPACSRRLSFPSTNLNAREGERCGGRETEREGRGEQDNGQTQSAWMVVDR